MSTLSPDALRIIEKTRNQGGPRPVDKARIRAAIDAAMTSCPPEATASNLVKTAPAKWIIVSGILLSIFIGIFMYRSMVSGTDSSTSSSAIPMNSQDPPIIDDSERPSKIVQKNDITEERENVVEIKSIEQENKIKVRRPQSEKNKRQGSSKASSLEEELKVLKAAQQERRKGNFRKALTHLDRHRVQFPHGLLRPEREAALVFTYCHIGNHKRAKTVAVRFLKHFPRSPLGHSVRNSCAFEENEKNND